MTQNKKYIAFQMNHRIDDEDSTFEYQGKDGREAYFQITRKENEEWVNEAFKQGYYQYTYDMEAPHHEAVFIYLNQGFRLTAQFCPSMSIGDLVYEMGTGKWFFCADFKWVEMEINFPWEIIDADSQNFYVKHTENRETGLNCGFTQKVPKIWFDRWFREVYDYQYEKCGNHEHCVKCMTINRHGNTTWNEFPVKSIELPNKEKIAEKRKLINAFIEEQRIKGKTDLSIEDAYVNDEDVKTLIDGIDWDKEFS